MSIEFGMMILLSIAFGPIILLASALVIGLVIDFILTSWFALFAAFGYKRPLLWWSKHTVVKPLRDRRFEE